MATTEQTRGLVRKLATQLGIEITSLSSKSSDRSYLADLLSSRKVNVVFDVGANVGQYGRELRSLGYRGRIISFEPVSHAHARLKKGAAADADWVVAPRTAIGSEEGVVSVKVPPSSIFRSDVKTGLVRPVDAKSIAFREEQVPLVTLNSLAPAYMKRGGGAFLKIDVRGFEYEVLHGADKILDALCGVQLKLSLAPFRQAGKPFRFMLDFMESRGFELHSLASVLGGDIAGREVQFDAVFIRSRGTVPRVQ